jgi:hypothetical protein
MMMLFLPQRYLARKVQILLDKRINLGFLGAFPKTVFGWKTMVVTAAVKMFDDSNG